MGYAELIEKLEALPDEKRAEVFDFVDYLAARFSTHRTSAVDQWTDREFTDMAMQQAVRGLDDPEKTWSTLTGRTWQTIPLSASRHARRNPAR